MRFDKLTVKAQQALANAQELATNLQNSVLTPMHVLAGLLREEDGGIVRALLQKTGCNAQRISDMVPV